MNNKCEAGHYRDNTVVTHSPLVCFGGFGQPRCPYLKGCLEDNEKGIKPRTYKRLIKELTWKEAE